MRYANDSEIWMATLLTKGAEEAKAEIGVGYSHKIEHRRADGVTMTMTDGDQGRLEQRYCDWLSEHNWQKTYTAIVEGKTVETVGKGAFEFDIAVPDGMTMQMHEVDGRHVISFEPESN